MPPRRRKRQLRADEGPNRPTRSEERWEAIFQSLSRVEIVLLAGAVLLLLVLIYTIQSILSPFLVLGAILFLLFPLRRYVLAKTLMWLSGILFGLWFLHTISAILAPFVVSLVLAYVLSPLVDQLQKWRVARWVSSLVLILLFVTGITLVLFLVVPIAVTQFEEVIDGLSVLFTDLNEAIWTSKVMAMLERYGISVEELRATVKGQVAPKFDDILQSMLRGTFDLLSSISRLVTQVFYVVIVPFLTFYLLWDFPVIKERFRLLFPKRNRDRVSAFLGRADALIGRYLRGAITVAILQGILVALLFWAFGIKNAIVMGIIAAVLDLVPYFGLIVTMLLGGVVALFSDPPIVPKVVFAVGSIAVLHLLEVTMLAPRIVGSKVGMHPLLIIFSLLVFAYFLGFIGLLIAVPVTALMILLVREWESYRRGIPFEQYHTIRD